MRTTEWRCTWNWTRHQLNKLGEQGQFIRERRESAIGFSFVVTNAGPPLCAQGCRSIEIIIVMWPFISQPVPSSFILFYSQHRDLTQRGGGGLRRAQVWLHLLFSERMGTICSNRFHGFWWSRLTCSCLKVWRVLNVMCTCCCSLFHFGIIPRQMNIILVVQHVLAC